MTRQRIEKVLELKDYKKKQLDLELKKAFDELDLEKARLNYIHNDIEKTIAYFESRRAGRPGNSSDLDAFYTYLLHLNTKLNAQKLAVSRKESELDQKRKAMAEAYREKRLIEIIHDKIVHKEAKKSLLLEQREADSGFAFRDSRQ